MDSHRNRLSLFAALALFGLTACDSTPTLSSLMATSPTIRAGDTLTLTAFLTDNGTDLDGGKEVVTITVSGGMPVVRELPIAIGTAARQASITLSIETVGFRPGNVEIDLQVVDKSGLKSNVVSTTVTLT